VWTIYKVAVVDENVKRRKRKEESIMNEEAESEKAKVYCLSCSYRKKMLDLKDYCYHPSVCLFVVSYLKRVRSSVTLCKVKNANNNCPDFK
jgi:hypothetical protein